MNRPERYGLFFLGSIEALVFALEAKDKYTAGHSRRVTEISLVISRELNLSEDFIEDLRWGSPAARCW